jgi:hypothetical protein
VVAYTGPVQVVGDTSYFNDQNLGVGADRGFDDEDFVQRYRALGITRHASKRSSAG